MIYEVLVDHAEAPNKCTILPLADRGDFEILRFKPNQRLKPLTGDLLLHPEGTPLNCLEAAFPVAKISAVDCTWKKLTRFVKRIDGPLPTLVGIPDGFLTAYPRRNKKDLDPEAGLATIEALFIASAFVGCWDESLFARYHFGAAFLALNKTTFARYGVGPCPLPS